MRTGRMEPLVLSMHLLYGTMSVYPPPPHTHTHTRTSTRNKHVHARSDLCMHVGLLAVGQRVRDPIARLSGIPLLTGVAV